MYERAVSALLAGLVIVTAMPAQAFAANNKKNENAIKGDVDGDDCRCLSALTGNIFNDNIPEM